MYLHVLHGKNKPKRAYIYLFTTFNLTQRMWFWAAYNIIKQKEKNKEKKETKNASKTIKW